MASDVECQRNCYSDHSGDAFQTVVDIIASVAEVHRSLSPGLRMTGSR